MTADAARQLLLEHAAEPNPAYTFRPVTSRLKPIEVIKACHGYRFAASWSVRWPTSIA